MFLEISPLRPENNNIIFLDREPQTFKHFLFFLRTGSLLASNVESLLALKTEAAYFDCELLMSVLERKLSSDIGMWRE